MPMMTWAYTAFKWNSRHVSGWAWGNCIPACINAAPLNTAPEPERSSFSISDGAFTACHPSGQMRVR